MKKCPRCGAKVSRDTKFCTHCGFNFMKYDEERQSADVIHNIQSSNKSQFITCPKCGQKIDDGMSFCPHCGYLIRRSNYNNSSQLQQPGYNNQTLDRAKKYSSGYFNWLFNTIKNPIRVSPNVHQYYGVTSLVAGFILMLLSFYNIVNNLSNIVNNIIGKYSGDSSDLSNASGITTIVNKVKNSSIKDAILLCLVGFIVYWLAGFLGRKFTADQHLNPFVYSNQLATFTNVALIGEIIVFILTLLSAYSFAFYIIDIVFVIYNVGMIYSIVRKSVSHNKIYVAIFASCCTPTAVVLVIKYLIHSFIMNQIL